MNFEEKLKLCKSIGGELKNSVCIVNGFPLDMEHPIYAYKKESQRLILTSPEKFLSSVPETFFDRDVIEGIKKSIKKGKPIEPLFLDVEYESGKVIEHEGRHRAKACEELGLKKIPVIIFCRNREGNFVNISKCEKVISKFFD